MPNIRAALEREDTSENTPGGVGGASIGVDFTVSVGQFYRAREKVFM